MHFIFLLTCAFHVVNNISDKRKSLMSARAWIQCYYRQFSYLIAVCALPVNCAGTAVYSTCSTCAINVTFCPVYKIKAYILPLMPPG